MSEDDSAANEPDVYVIVDTRSVVGNCALFWGPNRTGYPCELDKAGKYTRDQAARIERSRDTDKAIPLEFATSFVRHHVHASDIRAAPRLTDRTLMAVFERENMTTCLGKK